MRASLLVAPSLIVACGAALNVRVAVAQTGSILGQVVAPARGADSGSLGVRGLSIRLDGGTKRVTTDTAGRFLFADVVAGMHAINVVGAPSRLVLLNISVPAGDTARVLIDLSATTPNATQLARVVVSADRPLHVIGHLPDVNDNVIYAGKKTELIVMDSLRANLAQDVERQILGRVPGANFSETAGAGFPSNGIGFRGLDPTQSVEMNTRQNGVGIAADLFGYPETYYTPPAEALDRIEVVRGAGALAFGPQFGGAINYIIRGGRSGAPPQFSTSLTTGSYGHASAFNAISGGAGPWTFYAFLDYRGANGWRPNSDYHQTTAYASGTWKTSDRLTLGLEYTRYRNRIHMAGGLSDEEFAQDPADSFRARNWLASPWNISVLRAKYVVSEAARLETTVSYLASDRHLVWRNEDGGPASLDVVDPTTGMYQAREVERETFENWTTESRVIVDHAMLGKKATLAAGLRAGWNRMYRFEGGPGSTGTDFDMNLYGGGWERALHFRTPNAALFAEELLRLTDRMSVTPGLRYEFVRSTAQGYTEIDSSFAPRTVRYPLFGAGAEYIASESTVLYANATQSYRPILYEALTPVGSITRVDPALRAAHGYNADLGWRGTVADALKFDLGLFYLSYRDRIGTRTLSDGSSTFTETANIGNSVHKGAEAYIELDPLAATAARRTLGDVDLFASLAYIDAMYVSGPFRGNRVEQAPRNVNRVGVTYTRGRVGSTLQASHSSQSFGDANNNVVPNDGAVAGLVPAFTVLDYAGRVDFGRGFCMSFGVNNVANRRYFTKRTGEYPGPGILPGAARSYYVGIGAGF